MNKYIEGLIDRDTEKLRITDKNGWFHCPSCGKLIGVGNFCNFCGQRVK